VTAAVTREARFAGGVLLALGLIPLPFGVVYTLLGLYGVATSPDPATCAAFECGAGRGYAALALLFGLPPLGVAIFQIWVGDRVRRKGGGRLPGILCGVVGVLAAGIGIRAAPELILVMALGPLIILLGLLASNPYFSAPIPAAVQTGIQIGLWLAVLIGYVFVAAALAFRWRPPVIETSTTESQDTL
jgi:hypothetical protein